LTVNITQAGSTYIAAPGPITLVSSNLYQPNGVAVDGSGNVYIADSAHNAVKEWLVASNMVITLNTNGLNYPYGVAVDGAGNVYVDNESGNSLLLWSSASNTVTGLVTSGLAAPTSIAMDGVGNVYIADYYSYTIKEWSATASNLTTVVSGLNYPQGVSVDFLGNIFIADKNSSAIKQWSAASGAVTTLVSSPRANYPYAVAADAGANLYFVDQGGAVKEWAPASGNLTTNYAAPLHPVDALALDGAGNLYLADNDSNNGYTIKELPHAFVDPTTKFESYAAGNDVLPVVVPATQNLLGPCAPTNDQPWLTITGVTNGVVSFAFTTSTTNRTAFINLLGRKIAVTQFSYLLNTNLLLVGPGTGSNSVALRVNADVAQSWTASSQASWLHLVTTDGSGSTNVGFTIDANPGAQRSGTLTIAGQTLTVIQDAVLLGETARVEGPAAGSDSVVLRSFNSPWVASTNVPWLHLSPLNQSGPSSTNVIFSFDANTGATRTGNLTIAGLSLAITQAASNYVAANPLTNLVSSGLSSPQGVAVDGAGNVFVVDTGNNAIKEWLVASNTVITVVSNGLYSPYGVAVDGAGNVYIADTFNNAIEEWIAASNAVITLVSSGLNEPTGVAVDSLGNVYIADFNNGAVEEWSATSHTVTTLFSDLNTGPYAVTVDAAGNVYFADGYSGDVDKLSATGGSVTTLIPGLNNPQGLAADGAGNIFISDNFIRMWSAASNIVSTVRSLSTVAIAVDGMGNIYAADSAGRIREIPRAFVDPTAKLESAAAGNDALSVVLPATENLLAPFVPTNSQPWLTINGVTNGVVSFAFAANPGAARTNIINLLGKNISITQLSGIGVATPLTGTHRLGDGSLQFSFTNLPGASFTILASTNASLPLSNWTWLGAPVEGPAGQYQFTDPAPTNATRFYIFVSP
jgi:sugar lactone lactonase YvrE